MLIKIIHIQEFDFYEWLHVVEKLVCVVGKIVNSQPVLVLAKYQRETDNTITF